MVKKGLVSSSHELASFAGARCLQQGGNVVDAALTTSAVLSVVQNNMCGLGGDMFALVKFHGTVAELNASGRAAEMATIDLYRKKGYPAIPPRGPLGANTVPGMVRGWGDLQHKFGAKEFGDLLAPAIHYADDGFPITEKYVRSISDSSGDLGRFENWRKIFLPDGKVPRPGYNLVQKDLAGSLRAIAKSGVDEFYEGTLGKKITEGIAKQEGIITQADLEAHRSTWIEHPLSIDYRGIKIYETSPNSQAVTVLLWLNMLEKYDLSSMQPDSEAFLKLMHQTCLKAYAERAKSIGDPKSNPLPPEFITKKFAEAVLGRREAKEHHPRRFGAPEGDTTYFAVADSEGNCVSVIQSNYMGFGSGLVPEGTGIVLHDRGCYFSLDPSHHNALAPGKRTFHTLCASLGEKDGETLFAIGSMGGDIQPQIHAQLMTQVLDFGVDLQSAIDRPRWIIPSTIYENPSAIYTEVTAPKISGSNGLDVISLNGPSSLCGHAQAILRTSSGLFGAADPRGDGASVGF
jgi:gamma-glutamyltranspeptidase / glutathione hydrolase